MSDQPIVVPLSFRDSISDDDLNLQIPTEIVQRLLTSEDWRSIASAAGNAIKDELMEQAQSIKVA